MLYWVNLSGRRPEQIPAVLLRKKALYADTKPSLLQHFSCCLPFPPLQLLLIAGLTSSDKCLMVKQQPYHPPTPLLVHDSYYFHSTHPYKGQAALDYSPAQPCLLRICKIFLPPCSGHSCLAVMTLLQCLAQGTVQTGAPKIPLLRLQTQDPHQSQLLVWCLLWMLVSEGGGLSACHAMNMCIIGIASSHATSCVSIKTWIWKAASLDKMGSKVIYKIIKIGRWSSYVVEEEQSDKVFCWQQEEVQVQQV